jgi:biopolymer transport protein ExbB
VFKTQVELTETSLERLEELLGGARFEGRAAGEDGLVKQGTFILFGPVAFFASEDGAMAGVAEQKVGSLQPSVVGYADPLFGQMTVDMVANNKGPVPFDASLGNARKVEETRQTLWEHIQKGGVVMIPILGLAGAALMVILFKALSLSLVRMPREQHFGMFLKTINQGNKEKAVEAAESLPGPAGMMLRAGTAHLDGPKDLIEEVMFEKILDVRSRLQRLLPFIAVSAASAPLLGLLGTVTGIINTFKLLTVFGSGDVKMLSGGISEALITTEFGLIIAIPTILSHAFLSRKAKSYTERMERMAISFMSEVEKSRARNGVPQDPDSREQDDQPGVDVSVREIREKAGSRGDAESPPVAVGRTPTQEAAT